MKTNVLKKTALGLAIVAVLLLGVLGYRYYQLSHYGFQNLDDTSQIVYFDLHGNRLKGKQIINNDTYFFDEKTGVMKTGLVPYDQSQYYCDSEGKMQTGAITIKNQEYFFTKDGTMAKNKMIIQKEDKKETAFYYDASGVKQLGLQKFYNHMYYFDHTDGLVKNGSRMITVDGKKQPAMFYNDGHMKLGLQKYKDDYYYFQPDGKISRKKIQTITRNKQKQKSYFDADGKLAKGLQTIDGNSYYFDKNGAMYVGLKKLKNHNYYFLDTGVMAKDMWLNIEYQGIVQNVYFDANGCMKEPEKQPVPKPSTNVPSDMKDLEKGLLAILQQYGGNTGIYFKDLKTGKRLSINDQNMYPCCMIKVPALATIYQEAAKGHINTADYAYYIEKMITISDNTSYNIMMNAIGNNNGVKGVHMVNRFCQSIGMNATSLHHGLLPGNGYFTDGGSNTARPSDLGLLFEKIYYGQIVSPQSSKEMLNLLMYCDDPDALVGGLPAGTPFAHKTGCAYNYYHDGGIVFAPNRNFVLVVFSDGSSNYTSMMRAISSYVYQYVVSLG